jgi:hypothetical protein
MISAPYALGVFRRPGAVPARGHGRGGDGDGDGDGGEFKNAPTFLPTGPFLVPAKFVADPADLRITLRHNGVVRQDESTADMLFDLPAILAYITGITELRPGDLVLTGSPAGNGMHWGVFLAAGDLLEGEITGLGTQRNRCASEHGGSKPAHAARPALPVKQPRQRRSQFAAPQEAAR